MELQRCVRDLPLHLGMPVLGGRGFGGGQLTIDMTIKRPVEMGPSDLQLRFQISKREARVLEIENRLAKGASVL